jgi:hypothetical protein
MTHLEWAALMLENVTWENFQAFVLFFQCSKQMGTFQLAWQFANNSTKVWFFVKNLFQL